MRGVPLGRLARPLHDAAWADDVVVVLPTLRYAWNRSLPHTFNDGPLWAGRGSNVAISGGLATDRQWDQWRVSLVVAPTLAYSQNLPFQVIPARDTTWSQYANPFHPRPLSIDLPLRFGDRHLLRVDPGRTRLEVATRGFAAGLTAEPESWGPAVRNPLLLSTHGPGIPRIYLRNTEPLATRAGLVSARLFSGSLTESVFFDTVAINDQRSISAFRIELRPAFDTLLTVGLSRAVYRVRRPQMIHVLFRSLDAFRHWHRIPMPGDTLPNGELGKRADQLLSVSARYHVPAAGFDVYGEWARMELPRTLEELLTAAHHTGGFTVGAQWAQRKREVDYLRIQTEFTNLEQSLVYPERLTPDFYTGRVAPQGYTNRGQSVGAAIGPGSSSQWAAVDYFARRWELGLYGGRIRWENDAMYREPLPTLFKHDVSVYGGVRGGARLPWFDVTADVGLSYRYNYLFQNGFANFGGFRTVDIRGMHVILDVTPR